MKGLQVESDQKLIDKDKNLACKDVVIVEFQCRLREVQEALEAERQRGDSLEVGIAAEKVKLESTEEARKVSQAALNLAQDNYAKVQATVEPLINDLSWLQNYGVAHIANSILNSTELDREVVALIVASQAVGHRAGYVECAAHVETAFHTHWGTLHCFVNEQADDGLRKA
ncbi:hypothetical protein Hdeb2414_s0008g00293711 [Helianthus debilis subsp. tardiflorus]